MNTPDNLDKFEKGWSKLKVMLTSQPKSLELSKEDVLPRSSKAPKVSIEIKPLIIPKVSRAPKDANASRASNDTNTPKAVRALKDCSAPKAVRVAKDPNTPKAVRVPKDPNAPKATRAPKNPDAAKAGPVSAAKGSKSVTVAKGSNVSKVQGEVKVSTAVRVTKTAGSKQSTLVLPKNNKSSMSKIKHRILWTTLELVFLVGAAVAGIMVLLGYSARYFSGTSFLTSLLPFAVGILALIITTSGFLIVWWKLRKWLLSKVLFLPALIAFILAVVMGWFSMQDQFAVARGHFRTLLGGKQEAGRVTLAHQVYANYRRYDLEQMQKLLKRAEPFNSYIKDAAKAYKIDFNLLQGVAATESSFLPRDSADGGKGLFQITKVPNGVLEQVSKKLSEPSLSLQNPRHNAFVAAATFKYYLAQMNNDLFLGLLAYNIGPTNGGLRFIMQQYGATDFFTIQPYLQQLPRDYPIRVLTYSLAFRVWQKEGALLAYEEGKNAQHIQSIGIPGLLMDF